MRRLVVLVAIIVLAVLFVRPYGQPGQTAKGGFTIPRICYGVEVWGTPGVYRTC